MKKFLPAITIALSLALAGCGGGGGGGSDPAPTPEPQITTKSPVPVQESSYENAKSDGTPFGVPAEVPYATTVAYADFYQDGSHSIVTSTSEWPDNDPRKAVAGKILFYKNVNGSWVEDTKTLLVDNVGCISPRKAVVADFNGDKKPDVFFSCHGIDADPFPGEQQRMLLSQSDGKYKNVQMDIVCYCHGAAAAELTRPGYADLVITDTRPGQRPHILFNNGNGTFTKDETRLPDFTNKLIWTTEFVDVNGDGNYDLFLAGSDETNNPEYVIPPTVLINDGGNYFIKDRIELPPQASSVGTAVGATLDALFDNGQVYLLRVFTDKQPNDRVSIQRTNLKNGVTVELYSHAGTYPNGFTTWFGWIGKREGRIVSDDRSANVSVAM